MEAIILSGGFGTRLRPLTYTRPKILLPVLNKPLIQYPLELLPPEVDTVILAANYKKEMLEEFIHSLPLESGRRYIISEDPFPLGTGGAIKYAAKYLTDDFLVLNGDLISSTPIKQLVALHRNKNAFATITLWPVEDVREFGVVRVDADNRITQFVEKPASPADAPSNLINAGVYCLDIEVLDYIPSNKLVSLEKEIFPKIIENTGRFFGFKLEGYWIDVGKSESYLNAHLMLLRQRGVVFALGKDCILSGTLGNSCIGNSVVVEEGASLTNSVAFDEAYIYRNATILNSVIGEGAVIGKGAVVMDSLVGDSEVIKENERVEKKQIWTKAVPEGYPEKQIGNIIGE